MNLEKVNQKEGYETPEMKFVSINPREVLAQSGHEEQDI